VMRPWGFRFPWITGANCLSGSKSAHPSHPQKIISEINPNQPISQRVFAHATEIGSPRELSAIAGRVSFVTFLCPPKKSKRGGRLIKYDFYKIIP